MSFIVPNVGEVQALKDLLGAGGAAGVITLEAWTLKLFKSDTTLAETNVAGDFTAADFTGYTDKPLVRDTLSGHWTTPASGAPTSSWSSEASVAESTYADQTWTALSAQTIYGYIIVGATSGALIHAVKFPAAISLTVTATLTVTPRIGMG